MDPPAAASFDARPEEEPPREEDSEREWEPPPPKNKKENIQREWKEVQRWRRSDSLDEDIHVFIRKHLDDLNRSAGIQHVPGQHNYCVDTFGENFRFSFQCTMVRFLFHSYFVSHFISTFHLCFQVQKFSDSLFFI